MRNLKAVGRAFLDVYENMFSLLLMNVIWSLLALVPFSLILAVLQAPSDDPSTLTSAAFVLYLLCLLLALLTGPATYAMAVMMRNITEYQPVSLREFLATMLAHARRGWLMGVVGVTITFLLLINLFFYASLGGWSVALVPLFLMINLLWLIMLLYLYPMAVITEGGPLPVLRNCAIILFRYPFLSLIAAIIALLMLVVSTALIIPWLMLTMSLVMGISTRAIRSAVRRGHNLPEEDPIDTDLPPIGGDEEGRRPLPHYGWRAQRQEAPPRDEPTSQ